MLHAKYIDFQWKNSYTGKIDIFFIFLLLIISCHKSPDLDENTLLIVGNDRVSLEEFRNGYELDPTFPGYRKGEEGLQDYANLFIDKILCQKMAIQENLFEQPEYKKQLNYAKQKASIQALYRARVRDYLQVTDQEVNYAYQQMSRVLHLKHLFMPDSQQAAILYARLRKGENFDSLAKEIFKNVPPEKGGSDLGEVYWGDLDPSLENTAYQLKSNEFSTPVKSRWGYHILFLEDEHPYPKTSEKDLQTNQRKILKKLLAQKEQILATKYVKNFLDPLDIRVKSNAFMKISQLLHLQDEGQSSPRLVPVVYLSDEKLRTLTDNLQPDAKQIFMTYRLGQWTIDDFLERLAALPFDKRPRISSLKNFKDDVGLLIRNEFLYKEAERSGLDRSSYVDSVVYSFSSEIAYHHFLKDFYSKYRVPLDVLTYYQNKSGLEPPLTVLPGMRTLESYRHYYAALQLHNFLLERFKDLPIKINYSLVKKEAQQIDWNNPIRMVVIPEN